MLLISKLDYMHAIPGGKIALTLCALYGTYYILKQ